MIQGMYQFCNDNGRFPSCWESRNIGCMPHFHSSVEFVYVTEGEVGAMFNGRQLSIRAGQFFLVSSYSAHSYRSSESSRYHSIVMVVPLNFVPLYAPLLSKKVFSQCLSGDAVLNGEALHCLRMILSLGPCDDENENLTRSYIYVILGLAIHRIGLEDTPQDRFLSKKVLIYLQDNYLSPITLDSLSKEFGYSKYRFSHIFNQYLGCSLTQYLDSLRARHAANLLRMSDAPLLEIAMNSGFDSVRTFYRSFKKNYSMTPTHYRQTTTK